MSKKYKLRKWYPSLPNGLKVGNIVKKCARSARKNDDAYYKVLSESSVLSSPISKKEVENNPEFWEEIIEKNYETLSLKYAGKDKKCPNILIDEKNIEAYMRGHGIDSWSIHSVKRLSDGEVFTVGDKIYCCGSTGIIEKFTPVNNRIRLDTDCAGRPFLADFIKHHRKPLFITKDGVDIYEGDEFWFVFKSRFHKPLLKIAQNSLKYIDFDTYNYFSTKEKAEEWIEENKPKYSKAHIKEAIRETNICVTDRYTTIDTSSFWNVLKRLSG